jgi:REP element-mobilizing transposase RayT
MARARKRHVQGDLFARRQPWQRRSRREDAPKLGRPPKDPKRPSERHEVRPRLRAHESTHVNIHVRSDVGSLRKHDMFLALREATIVVAKYEAFRIVHMSIQRTHVHFIIEAQDRMVLAKGMQVFQISAAKQINRVVLERTGVKRRGSVFTDRYHARIMRTPREVRNCITYVLNNWRHHGEHQRRFARRWDIDPYSSAISFGGWKELADADVMPRPPSTYRPLVVWLPKTHLLAVLWRRHGLIRYEEIPGGHDERD